MDGTTLEELRKRTEEFIESKLNQNTKRAIEGAVRNFKKYLDGKGYYDMKRMTEFELDQLLGSWMLDLKKKEGEEYEPNTISAYFNRVGVHIQKLMNIDIHNDEKFKVSKQVLLAKKKDLNQKGKGNKPNKAAELQPSHEELLWTTGALGSDTPTALLHTVWFWCTKLLGFRACHESDQLRVGDFKIEYHEENGTKYVDFISWNERITKTRYGTSDLSREFVPKLFPNPENPARCPVLIFMKYMSKRPSTTLDPDNKFFLSINPHHKKDNKKPWYSIQNMGHNRIGKIMKLMAKHANIRGKYTNHSVRRTTCSQLVRAGVPLTVVAQLTGHKNIGSLLSYTTAGLEQQQDISNILQKKPTKRSALSTSSSNENNKRMAFDNQQPTHPPAVHFNQPWEPQARPVHRPQTQARPQPQAVPNTPLHQRPVQNLTSSPQRQLGRQTPQHAHTVNLDLDHRSNTNSNSVQQEVDTMSYVRSLFQGANIQSIGTININFYKS